MTNKFGIGNIVEVTKIDSRRDCSNDSLERCLLEKIKLEVFKIDNATLWGEMICCNCINTEDDVYKIWLYESELKLVAENEEEYNKIKDDNLMDYFEVLIAIKDGMKVQHIEWDDTEYVNYDENKKDIVDESGHSNSLQFNGDLHGKVWRKHKGKQKLPSYLEWVKLIPYDDVAQEIHCTREDLDKLQCSECPFGTNNDNVSKPCFEIQERIAELKRRYEF